MSRIPHYLGGDGAAQGRTHTGEAGVGYVFITGAGVADGDRIGIAGRLYEFDTAAAGSPVPAGANVRVGVSAGEGGAGAANSITQLVAAINADTGRTIDAADIGGNVCALVDRAAANPALTNPIDAGGTIAISGAAFVGGREFTHETYGRGRYTVVAQDVTTWVAGGGTEIPIGALATTQQPFLESVLVLRANAVVSPATVEFLFRQANTNRWILVCEDSGAVLAAADIITWKAFGPVET